MHASINLQSNTDYFRPDDSSVSSLIYFPESESRPVHTHRLDADMSADKSACRKGPLAVLLHNDVGSGLENGFEKT